MKRVVLSGYYGFDNLGDEAVLCSIITGLREIYPGIQITVLSANPAKTARLYRVEAVSRTSLPEIIRTLGQAQVLISGGGSLLQDVTGPLTIPYYLGIVLLAKLLGLKVMFYAQGIGPIQRKWNQKLVSYVSKKADLITVRDEQSKKLLHKLGIDDNSILVTADPVFALPVKPGMPGREVLAAMGISQGNPLAGIAVRDWPGLPGYRKAVAAAADHLAETGRQVIFIPFHYPHDVQPARAIVAQMKYPAHLIDQALTLPEALGLIAELDLMLGMRLHALIFAALAHVPLVGIAYDPKVTAFLRSLGLEPVGGAGAVGTRELVRKIDAALTKRDRLKAELAVAARGLGAKARENLYLVERIF